MLLNMLKQIEVVFQQNLFPTIESSGLRGVDPKDLIPLNLFRPGMEVFENFLQSQVVVIVFFAVGRFNESVGKLGVN